MRSSTFTTKTDAAGDYEIEIFDCPQPKSVVICVHGRGVRRWDGENFFANVAEHYADRVFMLVDQNQPYKTGCKLNSLEVMVVRVQNLITQAHTNYPGVPVIILSHSMGCGIATQLILDDVSKLLFVAPTAGNEHAKLLGRYGQDVANGKEIVSSDGLVKYISKEFYSSVADITWEDEYKKLLDRYPEVHVFESGNEEIVGPERLALRDMAFAGYKIIPGAKHNYSGEPLQQLFSELDNLL